MSVPTLNVAHELYHEFLTSSVEHFFADCSVTATRDATSGVSRFLMTPLEDGSIDLEWHGWRYHLRRSGHPFSENEMRLLAAIATVLTARYRMIFRPESAALNFQIFRGLPEDRFVSAFIDASPYLLTDGLPGATDPVADALEVLRLSSLTTYENRRVSLGVLLLGAKPDPHHPEPPPPRAAISYTTALNAIKSFHRLCDGMESVFLVNQAGTLLRLADLADWCASLPPLSLPTPTASVYRRHCLATVEGDHVCIVLSANGEIKVFAKGTQAFHFLGGRWRLTDASEKFRRWRLATGSRLVAEKLYTAALNLAEARRGALFVVVNSTADAAQLAVPTDLLANGSDAAAAGKARVNYLLEDQSVPEMPASILEAIAGLDGAVLVDRSGALLAFGAILRHEQVHAVHTPSVEGGRTAAALAASRFGKVLKVSEDGLVSFYENGRRIWEM